MFKSFRGKLTGSYLLIILMLLLIGGAMTYFGFKDYYLHNLQQRLTREAMLIADIIKYMQPESAATYHELCATAARDSAMRVSIIDQDGQVLGDSDYDASQLQTHKSRPEVYQALHGQTGVAIRYSATEKVNMLYVAVPFAHQQQTGVVRLAMPLSDLAAINHKILMIMLLALFISAALALLLSLYMASRIAGPLVEITAATRDLSSGNLQRRISCYGDDEMAYLASAFNDMSGNLEKGMIALNDMKNRFQTLLENTVNGIVLIDPGGIVSYANPAALKLLQIAEVMIGRSKTEVINHYELLEMISQVEAGWQPLHKELVLHQSGGKTVEVNIVPIGGDERSHQGVLAVLNDISDLKRIDQIRKDFVANVSHELKTPLASISGFAETLMHTSGEEQETVQEFSRIIYEEAQRLKTMINSLLELSRLEAEQSVVAFQPTDVDAVLRQALQVMQHQSRTQMINLEYLAPAGKPMIESDPDLIMQVVNNLLDNAVKYSAPGGTVKLQLEESESHIIIKVIDSGVGIPEPEQQRIFERFYRVDKARSRKTGGSGLGLAIAKHILEKLDGSITVISKPGEGSVFAVCLPK
ncbi:MAG TPA: ATP-binding protein [Syntrophomonas sp.]|nr:ATP-binding protein [Syntrophomonas sp.]